MLGGGIYLLAPVTRIKILSSASGVLSDMVG